MSSVMKTCGACQQSLPTSEFGFKNKAAGRLHSKCKTCSRAYARAHYVANTDVYLAKARVNNEAYRQRNMAIVAEALRGQVCCGCGSTHNLTHYNGGVDNGQAVHMAVHGGCSEEALYDALGGSVVVCHTCLGQHFGSNLLFWQSLKSAERAQLQEQRKAEGFQPVPKSYYKAYRRVASRAASV